MKPRFFATPTDFRRWLERNHESEQELLVGFYKRGSGKPSITWPESVDQALCFGWIDGLRKRIDDESYTIRFTRRKVRSNWSAINVGRVAELTRGGLMRPAGQRAFAARSEARSGIYSYERRAEAKLPPAAEREFRANAKAWSFFIAQAPWYQRTTIHWVMSAKKEETRLRRLTTLIADSAKAMTLPALTRYAKPDRREKKVRM
jgi:uncharacterized protein YdeI (YjbR/CyaY-like superfamily)